MHPFRDRQDAGRQLAAALLALTCDSPLVLGLPRGGVVLAAEVARVLAGELDVLVARKLAQPGRPELALGALAEGGEPLWDSDLLRWVGVRAVDLQPVVAAQRAEVARQVSAYRGDRALAVAGRTVVLVDDGLATGATARAALRALRGQGAARLVLAVPVAPPDRLAAVGADADEVVALRTPADFVAVGQSYADFTQVSDEEVRRLLARASR